MKQPGIKEADSGWAERRMKFPGLAERSAQEFTDENACAHTIVD